MSAGTGDQVARRSASAGFVGRSVVLFFAIGQLVSNLVFQLWSPTDLQSGVRFSPLIPPGAMFSIWSVIIAASVLWAILQVRPSAQHSDLRDRLVLPLGVLYACFALWLAAASLGQSSPLTLVVFVAIVAANYVAWRRISSARDEIARWKPVDRVVLYLSQGLYAGWTSMAFFVNVATVVQATGAPIDGNWGTTWQLLVVAAAAGTAVAFVLVSRGSIWYTIASCYALVGAGISSSTGGYPTLAVALGVGVALVVGSTIVVRLTESRRRASGARPA
jgi:hypothetical protein